MLGIIKNALPNWVKTLIRRVQFQYYWPYVKYIVNSETDFEISAAGFHSQVGQDAYVKEIFDRLKISNGFFIDIGCNDPFTINNTIYFERCGWRGLAIDPLPLQKHWSQRTAEFIQVALGETDALVELHIPSKNTSEFNDMFSALKTETIGKLSNLRGDQINTIKVQQTTLDNILTERSIKNVDFISIDVEGYEENVLRGVDLAKYDIGALAIENDFPSAYGRDSLRHLLISYGYIFYARLHPYDDIFISKKVAKQLSAKIG